MYAIFSKYNTLVCISKKAAESIKAKMFQAKCWCSQFICITPALSSCTKIERGNLRCTSETLAAWENV